MAKKLKDIEITHISLVKAGANNKTFIYKSIKDEPSYENIVSIAKQNDEQGIVYGIVYEPDTVDAHGDFTTADEIKKAAYNFMKALNNRNVDKEHTFKSEDAYVAESWLIRKGDSLFPEAKEGTWAVAIQLESDAIKKSVKDGELKGLSMAGKAVKEEVQKSGEDKNITEIIKSAIASVFKSFEGKKTPELNKEEIEKAIKGELEPLIKERDTLNGEVEKLKSNLAKSESERKELVTAITMSKQDTDPVTVDQNDAVAIAKAATELVKKESEKGNVLSVADAVMQLTKEKK